MRRIGSPSVRYTSLPAADLNVAVRPAQSTDATSHSPLNDDAVSEAGVQTPRPTGLAENISHQFGSESQASHRTYEANPIWQRPDDIFSMVDDTFDFDRIFADPRDPIDPSLTGLPDDTSNEPLSGAPGSSVAGPSTVPQEDATAGASRGAEYDHADEPASEADDGERALATFNKNEDIKLVLQKERPDLIPHLESLIRSSKGKGKSPA